MTRNAMMEKSGRSEAVAKARPEFLPRVDILENDQGFVLKADLPGVPESNLEITMERNVLTILGRPEEREAPRNELWREYRTGVFRRSFTLSDEVERDDIEARLENGVLTLMLPRSRASRPRKIAVKTG